MWQIILSLLAPILNFIYKKEADKEAAQKEIRNRLRETDATVNKASDVRNEYAELRKKLSDIRAQDDLQNK